MKTIVLFAYIIVLSSCSTLYYHTYGTVLNTKPGYIVDSYYTFKGYEFKSIVSVVESVPAGVQISVRHLSYSLIESDKFYSSVTISNKTGKSIHIKNVDLIHINSEDNELIQSTSNSLFKENTLVNESTFTYRREYDKSSLTKKITENIDIDIQMNDEIYKLQESYQLKWVKWVSKLNAWMSI